MTKVDVPAVSLFSTLVFHMNWALCFPSVGLDSVEGLNWFFLPFSATLQMLHNIAGHQWLQACG